MFTLNARHIRWLSPVMLTLAVGLVGGLQAENRASQHGTDEKAATDPKHFDLPGVDPEAIRPFKPCRRDIPADGGVQGFCDWGTRNVVAVGRAPLTGKGAQNVLLAQRAASALALRNVLAVCAGVPIGPGGHVKDIRNATVVLRGFVKDFKIAKTYTKTVKGKPYVFAEAHVPMFGVKSLAASFYASQVAVHKTVTAGLTRGQWPAPAAEETLAGSVLIIDARGTGLRPVIYPVIVSESGKILIDIHSLPRNVIVTRGLCAYGTYQTPLEQLRSSAPMPGLRTLPALATGPALPGSNIDGMTWGRWMLAQATKPATPPTSRPTTQPRTTPKRFVVRALRSKGKTKAVLVVHDKKALKLLASPKAAGLVKTGRVLILVDAAGAGLEGYLPPARPGLPPTVLAVGGR